MLAIIFVVVLALFAIAGIFITLEAKSKGQARASSPSKPPASRATPMND